MKFIKQVDLQCCFLLIFTISSIGPIAGCLRVNRCLLGLPEYTHDYGRHEKVMVEMRDGVKLCTNIYFPEGKGPWPVVLIRSPYNMLHFMNSMAKMFSFYGYVAIHQDVRGRYNSEGEWYFFLNEREDGSDMFAWLVEQPWQDGHIAMVGQSYFGFTELAMADLLPPEVKTIVPMSISTDWKSMISEGGMCRSDLTMGIAAAIPDSKLHMFNGRNFRRALKHFPPKDVDALYFDGPYDWFQELIGFVDSPSRLRELELICKEIPEKIDIPVLMISGWYDLFTDSQIADFNRLNSYHQSRLMIGPWTHFLGLSGDGDKDFPGAGNIIDYLPRILNWFDHHLRGGKLEEWGPVEIYAIGDSRWETYRRWPPETKPVRFYPSHAARANSCRGGQLSSRPPERNEHLTYLYDPLNPVPTKGGHSLIMYCLPGYGGKDPSSRDQNDICERDDVITFISEPLKEPLPVRGQIKVSLTVSSDAEDTAFTAKIIDLEPDGPALNITDSIIRLAYRKGERPENYKPGEKVKLNFDMHPTAWTIKPGHRLRLDISSSNFPAYHAHANRAGGWSVQADPIKAKQTIYIGINDTAGVELPVLINDK